MNGHKQKSIKANFMFNAIYQVFLLIIPLITTPYISRVLSADGVGQYSFTSSMQSYFTLVAALGFGYYAQREIANYQNDKKQQSKIFWEIIVVRSFSVALSLLINFILILSNAYQTYQSLMVWWSFSILAVAFDITFLLQGNEDFGRIVGRNVAIKLLSVLLIFAFVKKQSDVWLYVLLTSIAGLLGNVSLWFYLPKYLEKISLNELRPLRHLRPTIKLFIPTIATSIYTVLDKTLIGFLIPDTYTYQETQIIGGIETVVSVVRKYSDLENGYYEQSEKIVKMCLAVIGALGTVMIPRNSKLYSEGKNDEIINNFYFATDFVWILGIPMTLGLAAIAPNIIPWFLGDGYEKCILLMQLFTPLIVLIGFSNVFGCQYLIPTQRDKKYTIGVLTGTISNLALNCILIPFLWSYGAVIASLISESLVTFTMYLLIRKEIKLSIILKQSIKPLVAGGVMFACVYVTQFFLTSTWYHTILLILEGTLIYGLMIVLLRDEFVLKYLKKISSKCA